MINAMVPNNEQNEAVADEEFLESTAPLSEIVDSSYEEKEAMAVEVIFSDLKQSRHEEEKEEKAVAASKRGGRI
ncbi:TMV resistance protein N-like [Pyrus ussuriensis x Pyrus communis]|uniref:TMV resistance protein N-like n=1 Tax=Pyrus ussuriensis x Pyrus communis TaxID=2448454 RepID=A0A5N5HNT1_9ROSA|nr:TMV resistance protein N-like [Pyrus ussuriensis x Pyrus communis]